MAEKKQTIADAFIAWHAEEVKASKDGKNPHFRSTYSTLEEVIAACRKAGQHGLTFTQLIDMDDTGRMFVKTIVMHVNGEVLTSRTPIVSSDLSIHRRWGQVLPMPNAMVCKLHLVYRQKMTTEIKQQNQRLTKNQCHTTHQKTNRQNTRSNTWIKNLVQTRAGSSPLQKKMSNTLASQSCQVNSTLKSGSKQIGDEYEPRCVLFKKEINGQRKLGCLYRSWFDA